MRSFFQLLVLAVIVTPTLSASSQEAVTRDPRIKGPTADQLLAREHHQKGRELMRAERFEQAVEELRQAVRLDTELVMAHYDLGQALMAVREYPAAVTAYTSCREAWLRFADQLQKGGFEADATREDRIRELRDRVMELQRIPAAPGSPQATRIQNEISRTENLIQSLDVSRSRGQQRLELPAELSLALGSAYFRCGRLEDAEREYKAAVDVQPKLGQAHNNLAVVYLMQKRPAEAREAVKRAEKAGFRVNPELKKDIDAALKSPHP
jgi:tetratricopeptide (TPR) repeat protein